MNYVKLDEFPNYEIYEDSKIIRTDRLSKNGKTLKRRELFPTKAKNGYWTVRLMNKDGVMKQFYLHRLIWMAFNGEIPEGYEIDHLIDRSDNDLNHLRMVSHKDNCNNPKSIERYRKSNALSAGKFNRDRMQAAKSQENKERLRREYESMLKETGSVGVYAFMKSAHCNYYTALRIKVEMEDKTDANQ